MDGTRPCDGRHPGPPDPKRGSRTLGAPVGFGRSALRLRPSIALAQPARNRFYRITLNSTDGRAWALAQVAFFNRKRRVEAGGPHHFTSAWMPEGKGEEWVYVDLGARCTFDRVTLHWIRRAAEGVIQVSDDASTWKDLRPLPAEASLRTISSSRRRQQARYVRVLMKRPASPDGYILSELEVYGRGGPVPEPKPAPAARADGRLDLAGGRWRFQRDSLVDADGAGSPNRDSMTRIGSSPRCPARFFPATGTRERCRTRTTATTS